MNNDSSGIQQEGRQGQVVCEGDSGPKELEESRASYLKAPPGELPERSRLVRESGLYCVSDTGVVYSCRTRGGLFVNWTPMTPELNRAGNAGRLEVNLRIGSSVLRKPIHRLVLETFIGPCPPGHQGCHNDGNGTNNRLGNLRWDTPKNNMADRIAHGTDPTGSRNPAAVLDESKVREIRRLHREGRFQKDIAPMFGVSKQCVQLVCKRETWQHVSD